MRRERAYGLYIVMPEGMVMSNEKRPEKTGVDRRDFLKGVGAVAGAAVIAPNIAACGGEESGKSSLKPVRGDGSSPLHYIENVVIVQMENRSFDHYFGSLSLDEGRTDVRGLTPEMSNPTTEGGMQVPIEWLASEYIIHPDPGHSHEACVRQWNNGQNDGFVIDWERLLTEEEYDQKIGWALGYYKREQLPAFYKLADHFTLCDHWFCSMLGPTWPNRFYSYAATSDGFRVNLNPLQSQTIFTKLENEGQTLKVYVQNILSLLLTTDVFAKNRRTGSMQNFFADAAAGNLPNISVVEPDYSLNDDHPPQDVRLGQSYVASIYEALRTSPQWERTLMIVFYDEHGGFFDSVAPPTVEGEERAGFEQLGFRVPGMLIGPLVKKGHVMKTVVDHSSVPRLLSEIFESTQINERAAKSGSFMDAFELEYIDPNKRPEPPELTSIEIPHEKIRFALSQDYGQPELLDFARKNFGLDIGSYDQRLRDAENFFVQLERMRVARVTG